MLSTKGRMTLGGYTVAIENGSLYVTDGVKIIKVTVDISLGAITNYRNTSVLNSEKFYYGVTKPLLKQNEKATLKRFLDLAEETLIEALALHLTTTRCLNAHDLHRALQVRNGYEVTVAQKLCKAVA